MAYVLKRSLGNRIYFKIRAFCNGPAFLGSIGYKDRPLTNLWSYGHCDFDELHMAVYVAFDQGEDGVNLNMKIQPENEEFWWPSMKLMLKICDRPNSRMGRDYIRRKIMCFISKNPEASSEVTGDVDAFLQRLRRYQMPTLKRYLCRLIHNLNMNILSKRLGSSHEVFSGELETEDMVIPFAHILPRTEENDIVHVEPSDDAILSCRRDSGEPLRVLKYQVHDGRIRLNHLLSMVAILMKRVERDLNTFEE